MIIIVPERMSERSISSDWTPMLLLKAFLQEEPLTSRSKSTGSNGELYRPYLQGNEQEGLEFRNKYERDDTVAEMSVHLLRIT